MFLPSCPYCKAELELNNYYSEITPKKVTHFCTGYCLICGTDYQWLNTYPTAEPWEEKNVAMIEITL